MAETSSGIVELVRGIVEPLVDDVDAVEVTSTFTNDGCELVEIRVLARAAACGNGNAVEVELVEG